MGEKVREKLFFFIYIYIKYVQNFLTHERFYIMRRTASEMLNELESRIARLENRTAKTAGSKRELEKVLTQLMKVEDEIDTLNAYTNNIGLQGEFQGMFSHGKESYALIDAMNGLSEFQEKYSTVVESLRKIIASK